MGPCGPACQVFERHGRRNLCLPGISRRHQSMSKLEEWLTERKVGEVECLVPDMSGIARGKILPATKFIKSTREHSLRLPESIVIQTVTGEYAEDEDDEVMGPQDHDVNLQPDPD